VANRLNASAKQQAGTRRLNYGGALYSRLAGQPIMLKGVKFLPYSLDSLQAQPGYFPGVRPRLCGLGTRCGLPMEIGQGNDRHRAHAVLIRYMV